MKNMFNVTTVLPHNLLKNEPLHSSQLFDTSLQKARGKTSHYVGPELRYIFWPPGGQKM